MPLDADARPHRQGRRLEPGRLRLQIFAVTGPPPAADACGCASPSAGARAAASPARPPGHKPYRSAERPEPPLRHRRRTSRAGRTRPPCATRGQPGTARRGKPAVAASGHHTTDEKDRVWPVDGAFGGHAGALPYRASKVHRPSKRGRLTNPDPPLQHLLLPSQPDRYLLCDRHWDCTLLSLSNDTCVTRFGSEESENSYRTDTQNERYHP
jgi:hypothetical protein